MENYLIYSILTAISSLFYSISWVIVTIIKEKNKIKRIDMLEKVKAKQIKAIGNYEYKSKTKIFLRK